MRLSVAIQMPDDLDKAYQLALLHEELGGGSNHCNSYWVPSSTVLVRRGQALSLPPLPRSTPVKPVEDRRSTNTSKPVDDKWSALRAYRRSKGLCFLCGEKWSREHLCKQVVSLHVVQEIVDFMSLTTDQLDDSCSEPDSPTGHLMALSAAAVGAATSV